VRELRNILEWAMLMAGGHTIMPSHLPDDLKLDSDVQPVEHLFSGSVRPLETLEHDYLRWAIATHGQDRVKLAQQLGVSERTLYRKLAQAKAGGKS